MMIKSVRLDLGDVFLGLMLLGLISLFGAVSVPNLVSIFNGSHRAMLLPDHSSVLMAPWMTGQVDSAKRDGGSVLISGWARDPRLPGVPITIQVFYGPMLLGQGPVEYDPAKADPRNQPAYQIALALPQGFDVSKPFRVFAMTKSGNAVELYRGVGPVYLAEDLAIKQLVPQTGPLGGKR
jgi:hypothetical protein